MSYFAQFHLLRPPRSPAGAADWLISLGWESRGTDSTSALLFVLNTLSLSIAQLQEMRPESQACALKNGYLHEVFLSYFVQGLLGLLKSITITFLDFVYKHCLLQHFSLDQLF
jgi:hypothetical protein